MLDVIVSTLNRVRSPNRDIFILVYDLVSIIPIGFSFLSTVFLENKILCLMVLVYILFILFCTAIFFIGDLVEKYKVYKYNTQPIQ